LKLREAHVEIQRAGIFAIPVDIPAADADIWAIRVFHTQTDVEIRERGHDRRRDLERRSIRHPLEGAKA